MFWSHSVGEPTDCTCRRTLNRVTPESKMYTHVSTALQYVLPVLCEETTLSHETYSRQQTALSPRLTSKLTLVYSSWAERWWYPWGICQLGWTELSNGAQSALLMCRTRTVENVCFKPRSSFLFSLIASDKQNKHWHIFILDIISCSFHTFISVRYKLQTSQNLNLKSHQLN